MSAIPTRSRKRAVAPALSTEESATLAEHELTISQGLSAFLAVGQALIVIRDGKLYRVNHKTFEDYCLGRWRIGRAQGYRLMEAAEIVLKLSPNGRQFVKNERQARALAAAPPHLREEVIEQVQKEGGELTEQAVGRIVSRLLDEKQTAMRDAAERGNSVTAREAKEEEGDEDETVASDTDEAGGEQDSSEPTTASTLRRAARKTEKQRLYLPRGLEHLRLAVKDFRKIDMGDVETADARQALYEGLIAADEVFSRVRLLAASAEEGAAAR